MTGKEVADIVRAQIGDKWEGPHSHGIDLSRCLVPPTEISIIARTARKGRVSDEVLRVWLVLEERIVERDGYKIVFNETMRSFGLVSSGYASDSNPILCGWYGGFMSALEGM